MFRQRALFWAGKSLHRSAQFRFQSTTANTINNDIKKKSSQYSLIFASFILGGTTAYLFPLSSIAKFAISDRLPDPGSQPSEVEAFKAKLETKLEQLPIYKELTNDPHYESVRAWNYSDSNILNQTLTSGTLSVPGGIAIKPVLFCNPSANETVAIVHVGERLSGYPFLVHGGILATILDETLKRSSSYQFGLDPIKDYTPDKIKTKKIEIQYKFPTFVNNFIIVKTKIVDGKVDGRIETTTGRLLVKGLGEFEKRNATPLIIKNSDGSNKRSKWTFGLF